MEPIQIKSCGTPCNTIIVGNCHILNELAKTVNKLFDGMHFEIEGGVINPATLTFPRDLRVVLWDGIHLIPSAFSLTERSQELFLSILPSSYEFLKREKDPEILGRGTQPDWREFIIQESQRTGTPIKLGKTILEGGNCRLFLSGTGEKKAIVGEFSLFLSYLLLKERGSLPSQRTPSAAKEDGELFEEEARRFEADLTFTKAQIAEDLEIPLNHIAFIPQEEFHIDLRLFVAEDGTIFYHDEQLAQDLLREHSEGDYTQDLEALERNQRTISEVESRLRSIGCTLIRVPGFFASPSKQHVVNFMNGLSLSKGGDNYFITNGCRLAAISERFKKLVEENSRTQVVFIADNKDLFPRLLAKQRGGIHCITSIKNSKP